MPDPADVSFWLETSGDDLAARPPLDGSVEVDVAILGAGYTGLWTAYALQRQDPSLRIAVVEAEVAGFGASGRNGAWAVAGLGITVGELARRFGDDAARRTTSALRDTLAVMAEVCRAESMDVGWRPSGILRLARGEHERAAIEAGLAVREHLGLADGYRVLDAEEVAERVRVTGVVGALSDPYGATLHPGRLVRGLARAVERRGATIYEGTRVVSMGSGPAPVLRTERGDVRAGVVVLAGEAWLSKLPGWRRTVLPLYSLVVLTEPLPDAVWDQIGWAGGESLSSNRLSVDYLSRTGDGRILFGGRGAPYRWGSQLEPAMDRHGPTHEMLRGAARSWFPAIADAQFTHAWGGPVGMPRDWVPTWTFDRATGIAAAYGYTGQGVAAANLAGRVLADQITGAADDGRWAYLPMVRPGGRRWEPEPLRWLAARGVQQGLARADDRARRTGRPPSPRNLAVRLSRH